MPKSRLPVWLIAVLLALVTLAEYWPATRCGFVNHDDDRYVTANLPVQSGLNWQTIRWGWSNTVVATWHPLTLWSHALDCQLFGLNPWGHHLTSVVLHTLNTLLVFLWLHALTGALWRSLLVAALFGWHPLHVESATWVSERKDMLSGFFGLLALIAYARYGEGRMVNAECRMQRPATPDPQPATPHTQHATRNTEHATRNTLHPPRSALHALSFYLLSLLFFALGLLSKPMLVTWPFVLLLLDYWPLGRMQKVECRMQNAEASDTHHAPRNTSTLRRTCYGGRAPRTTPDAVALGVGKAPILRSCGGSVCRDLRRAAARRRIVAG